MFPKLMLTMAALAVAANFALVGEEGGPACGDPVLCKETRCPDGFPNPLLVSCCVDKLGTLPAFKPNPAGEEEKNFQRLCGVQFDAGHPTGFSCGDPAVTPGEDKCGTIPGE